jgi:phenylacetate-CoA ligase
MSTQSENHRRQLHTLVTHARRHSRYYASAFAHLPEQTCELDRLPLLDTAGFWRIDGDLGDWHALTAAPDDAYVFRSGGSTGHGKISICSRAEWNGICTRYGAAIGTRLSPGDRVANLFFSGDLYASHLFIHGALSRVPFAISQFPFAGMADMDALAQGLHRYGVNVLAVVPTHLLALAEWLERDGRALPQIDTILYGGDSLFDDCMPLLSRVFPNADCHSIGYASVEIGVLGASLPDCDPGEHRSFDGETIIEIIDETSGDAISEVGRPGMLVATSLSRRLTPLIRCPSGDLASWCEPPGAARKFVLTGRSTLSHQIRVGHVFLVPDEIERSVGAVLGHGALWQIHLSRRDATDHVGLYIVANGDALIAQAVLSRFIAQHIGVPEMIEAGQLIVELQWCNPGTLELNARTGKLRRVVDRRAAEVSV